MKSAFATTAVILFALVYYALQRSPSPVPAAPPGTPAVVLARSSSATIAAPSDVAAAPPKAAAEIVASADPIPTYEASATELVPLAGPADAAHATVKVRGGDSLWRIANRAYGDGGRARAIYEANRDQVADPERIYPGQVLVLP